MTLKHRKYDKSKITTSIILLLLLLLASAASAQVSCPNCGYSNPSTNKFCNKCGASLLKETTPAKRTRETCQIIDIVGDRVMLDAGKERGVITGLKYSIEVVDSVVRNRLTGEILKAFTRKTAELIVEEIEDKYSWARVKLLDSSYLPVIGTIGTEVKPTGITGSALSAVFPGASFVEIPSGSFIMGSQQGYADETPTHNLTILGFHLMKTEVTQRQWNLLIKENPSQIRGDELPVNGVTPAEISIFIKYLSQIDSRYKFRLPTEAEWEYACRAGTVSEYCYGDSVSELGGYGWYKENSGGAPHAVSLLNPNAWRLYDMHGNVKEVCSDYYAKDFYQNSPVVSPKGPNKGTKWVCRGGGFESRPEELRSSARSSSDYGSSVVYYDDRFRYRGIGFRLVVESK
jgi:formylglycine-generating enzyme required for sulfatase activity/ribosomal protein S27E